MPTGSRTRFFQTCLGAFQGGGCCAAALVGAYESAVRHGVQFVEVVGTSAGAILAALVGAGASPAQLNEFISELDFKRFLIPAETSLKDYNPGMLQARIIKWCYGTAVENLIRQQGMYSSSEIEKWVAGCLERLLPQEKRPICFESLIIPTAIVATDLLKREVQVWSSKDTPNAEVAHAVRASCSIPLFFQPVDGRYVDGGVLSNLPTFIYFQNHSESDRPLASRVLAFTLEGKEQNDPIISGKQKNNKVPPLAFFKALASTIVGGSQRLQLGMQRDVHTIAIPTGNIEATDFEKMDSKIVQGLIQKGRLAADSFFDEELGRVRSASPVGNILYGLDEMYSSIVENLERPIKEILITEEDTNWVYPLFPALLCWRTNNVKIRVAISRSVNDSDKEIYRRKLLKSLGIEVSEHSFVPLRAYLFDPENSDGGATAIVRIPSAASARKIEAVRYDSPIDQAAINMICQQLSDLCPISPSEAPPTIINGNEPELISILKRLTQYAPDTVNLRSETVKVSSLVSLTHFVREFKYRQIRHLHKLFIKNNRVPFEVLNVRFHDGQKSIITPPVVESLGGGQYALIEGSTRSIFCRNEGIEEIRCIVAREVQTPLPATRVDLNRVRIVGRTLDVHDRYEGFNYAQFRHIEGTVHRPSSLQ